MYVGKRIRVCVNGEFACSLLRLSRLRVCTGYLLTVCVTCRQVRLRTLQIACICLCKHTYVEARTRATGRLIGEWPAKSLARPIETSSSHLFPISGRLVIGYRLPTNKCTRLRPRRVFANCLVLSNLFLSYTFFFCANLYSD